MLKNLCQLEVVIADKVCHFLCENDTDTNVIREALLHFQKFIQSIEDIAKANKEAADKIAEVAQDAPVADLVVESVAEIAEEFIQLPVEN